MPRSLSSLVGPLLTILCLAVVLGITATLTVNAQTTSGTLLGAVQDQHGKGLSGVKVTLENEENSNRRATKTDDYGNYAIFNLPPGTYKIIASKGGFRDQAITGFPIQFNQINVVKLPVITLLTARLQRTVIDSAENRWFKPQFILTSAEITPSEMAASSGAAVVIGYKSQEQAALANTTDAARSSNFSEQQIHTLPIGGATAMRSFDELTLLLPGVAPAPYTPGVRGPGVGFGIGTAGQFSVNGMRARANNFSIDGSDNNDSDVGVRRQGFMALVPQPIESVKEISISTLLWDAELGRNIGGQVNAVSKYGSNEFHGQAYAFFNDSRLNARNFFASGDKPPFTRTQLGLTFGGPLVRPSSQFFLSFEDNQTNSSVVEHFATPAPAERNLFGPGAKFMATAPTGPFTEVTPLGRNVLSNYPAPNNPAGPFGPNTFTQRLPADGDGKVFSVKLTDQLNPDHSANLRYNFSKDRRILPSVGGAIRSTLDSDTRSHNLSLIVDSALGSRLFNQARFSFGRTQLNLKPYVGNPLIFSSNSIETDPAECVGLTPCTSQTGPMGQLVIVPYSPVGVDTFTFPQRRASNTFQYADSLSLTKGKHLIKFGGNIRHYQLNSVLDRLYRPQVVFGGALLAAPGDPVVPISGVQLASIGVASSLFQTITNGTPDSTIGLRFTEFQTFINDNWRVHPRLSLDLGLRYELNTVPVEVNKRIERAISLEGLPVAGSSRFDTPVRTFRYGAAIDTYRQILGGRTKIYDPDRNNFGPHVGFAWALDAKHETSLRAGYGIYYDVVLGAVVSQSRNVFPNEVPINVDPNFLGFDLLSLNNPIFLALTVDATNNPVVPVVRLLASGSCNQFGTCNRFGSVSEDFAALIGQLFIQNRNGGLAFTLPEKNLRTPYVQQWHLTYEREVRNNYVWSVAYVGTKGTKLLRLTTPNRGPNVTPQIQVLPPMLPLQPFPLLNLSSATRTGFLLVLPDHETCAGGGGVAIGPPDAIFCLEPDDRPSPFAGPFQIFESSASSTYHALQLEARKRYHQSYQFTAAYTWSHAIDDVSDVFPIAGAPIIAQDSANLRAERASANFDVRHRFAASLIWDLPFFHKSRSVTGRVLNNWQIASVFQAQTGQPFTLNVPFDANLDGNLTDRASTTDGLIFLGGNLQRVAIAPGRSVTDFFVLEKNGVVGRNTVRGAGLVNFDLAVSRTFQFGEEKKLQFRAEFFNVFNRANFGLPVRTIGSPGFGSATATATPGRMIVLAVKSSF